MNPETTDANQFFATDVNQFFRTDVNQFFTTYNNIGLKKVGDGNEMEKDERKLEKTCIV